ncbi:VanZ family protein [Solibacillus silvestris]|nr:VanZ family protein [Solibacillus silvestris]OBW58420.1 VanZ family protein [Solibacillus silvestris]
MLKSLSWIAVVLWMILIFYFSKQPVHISNDLSTTITEQLIEMAQMVAPVEEVHVSTVNHFVRKNAHFFIYFCLGIFAFFALRISGIKSFHSIWVALIFCIIYAVSDEFHQLFVPGRGAQVKDVLIDCAGATLGIGTATIISSIRARKKVLSKKGISK